MDVSVHWLVGHFLRHMLHLFGRSKRLRPPQSRGFLSFEFCEASPATNRVANNNNNSIPSCRRCLERTCKTSIIYIIFTWIQICCRFGFMVFNFLFKMREILRISIYYQNHYKGHILRDWVDYSKAFRNLKVHKPSYGIIIYGVPTDEFKLTDTTNIEVIKGLERTLFWKPAKRSPKSHLPVGKIKNRRIIKSSRIKPS